MTLLEPEGLLLSISDDGIMLMTNLTVLRGKSALPLPPPLEGPPVCLQRMSDLQVPDIPLVQKFSSMPIRDLLYFGNASKSAGGMLDS